MATKAVRDRRRLFPGQHSLRVWNPPMFQAPANMVDARPAVESSAALGRSPEAVIRLAQRVEGETPHQIWIPWMGRFPAGLHVGRAHLHRNGGLEK